MPLLVGDLGDGSARTMACTVDQRVDPPPFLHRGIDKPLQVVIRLVGTRHTNTAEFGCQSLAFFGRRQDRHFEAVSRKPLGGLGTHSTATSRDDGDFFYCHGGRPSRRCID
ncbi:hypothetical protein D3C71_1088830 [compost metagenome]